MKLRMYSIKDTKSGEYHQPHHATNDVVAMRGIQSVIRSGKTTLSQYPQEFDLVEVGEWDDETGTLIGRIGGPRHVTTCAALAPLQPPQQAAPAAVDKLETSIVRLEQQSLFPASATAQQ